MLNVDPVARWWREAFRVTPLVVVMVGCLAAVTGCGGSTSGSAKLLVDRPRVQFGYIRALAEHGETYSLRFDLALMLTGETGVLACIHDRVCNSGTKALADDYYIRDLHSPLTYGLPANARVTVVTIVERPPGDQRSSSTLPISRSASCTTSYTDEIHTTAHCLIRGSSILGSGSSLETGAIPSRGSSSSTSRKLKRHFCEHWGMQGSGHARFVLGQTPIYLRSSE